MHLDQRALRGLGQRHQSEDLHHRGRAGPAGVVGGAIEEAAREYYYLLVIGTPGRLLYHLQNTKGFNLRMLKYLVFDEADKLLNMDFEKEIN
mgnify:CR=1 FL=1